MNEIKLPPGWTLLEHWPSGDASHLIVVACFNPRANLKFVVWLYNTTTEGCAYGDYRGTVEELVVALRNKRQLYHCA